MVQVPLVYDVTSLTLGSAAVSSLTSYVIRENAPIMLRLGCLPNVGPMLGDLEKQ